MERSDLEVRTRRLAARMIRFSTTIRGLEYERGVARQLVKAGTSIGANCKEASRAESKRAFIHKIAIAEKECAETQYWLDFCHDVAIGDQRRLEDLSGEIAEVLAILVTIGRNAKGIPRSR
jgi:four helix bundle protein